MSQTDVVNLDNEKVGSVELPDEIFTVKVKPHLFWEVIRYQQAKRRQGSHSAKTRAEVKATGAKMYKQKGTGRARHGSRRAPIFVGGGVAFPPKQRDHAFRVPKKVRRAALRCALSLRFSQGKLKVLEDFNLTEPKTKGLVHVLGKLETDNALILDAENQNLYLSSRNLPKVTYLPVAGLNLFDILKHEDLIITTKALEGMQGRLA
ncbi:MAG: 50S ribosomal protein L4 [Deltaproteobacteria bacterium]|nr:50S ribosomal protein L4 [Deltaproteobacteria bacterium]